jgi:transposase
MRYFAGLDWAAAVHAICVIDNAGRVIARFAVEHTAEGIEAMLGRFARIASAAELPIAIERPSGLLVDALIEGGHPVVPIHPNVVKACRPRYRAVGGKSDPGDAYMLADILRTDGHRFRTLEACSDEIKALRILVRSRDDLVAERIALANRLRSLTGKQLEGRSLATQEGRDPTRLVDIGEFEGDGHLRVLVRKASDISPESGQRALQRPKHLRTYLGRLAGLV